MTAPIRVVAGVLRDAQGRILLAQRPPGKHLAGLWEFPGGKCEPGEAPVDTLARELREELGVIAESARPLIRVPHRYPEKAIVLDAWQVDAYAGEPQPREAQRLAWVEMDALDRLQMPAADHPVIAALRLPDRYLITPALPPGDADALLHGIARACDAGIRLVQLRLPGWSRAQLADTARRARNLCHARGVRLLLNQDWRLAAILGFDGAHLPARVAATFTQRPLPADQWLGVSCHDAAELEHAQCIGADFATLSPIFETPSHPAAMPLGWDRFAELVATAALPVFALGDLEPDELDTARMAGAQGIAAIRGLWR